MNEVSSSVGCGDYQNGDGEIIVLEPGSGIERDHRRICVVVTCPEEKGTP